MRERGRWKLVCFIDVAQTPYPVPVCEDAAARPLAGQLAALAVAVAVKYSAHWCCALERGMIFLAVRHSHLISQLIFSPSLAFSIFYFFESSLRRHERKLSTGCNVRSRFPCVTAILAHNHYNSSGGGGGSSFSRLVLLVSSC